MKTCKVCGREKFEDSFYVKDRKTGRLSGKCKDCQKEVSRKYYENNGEVMRERIYAYQKANPEVQARARAKRKANGKRRLQDIRQNYGVSPSQYAEMLERAGGLCEICGRVPSEVSKKGPCVDHCHDSGKVRGILCSPCNSALGGFRDDPEVLRKAIEYLETHAPKPVIH